MYIELSHVDILQTNTPKILNVFLEIYPKNLLIVLRKVGWKQNGASLDCGLNKKKIAEHLPMEPGGPPTLTHKKTKVSRSDF